MKPRTIRIPVDVFIVTAVCKKCGAEMVATPSSRVVSPVDHVCPTCGSSATFDKTYPCTEYERRDLTKGRTP